MILPDGKMGFAGGAGANALRALGSQRTSFEPLDRYCSDKLVFEEVCCAQRLGFPRGEAVRRSLTEEERRYLQNSFAASKNALCLDMF